MICGHDRTCIFGHMYKGVRKRYCLACLIEKVGLPTIDEQRKDAITKDEVVVEQEEKKVETAAERMSKVRLAKKQ